MMALRFSMLASGSSGNACLIEADGFGVLVDAGLGPRQLSGRLAAVGASWRHVHAVLLTHTHGDHWRDRTLAHLERLGVPLYCHTHHHVTLRSASSAFASLRRAKLVRGYEPGEELELSPALRCFPLPLYHDDGMTCGFRFEALPDLFGHAASVAYLADLGCWQPALADTLADVDALALEFNHDVVLEETSGRSAALIMRVLGDHGHLSNAQAADLLRAVLKRSQPGRLKHLVQLHLSRECNRPAMALDAARVVLRELDVELDVHTAQQDEPGPSLTIGVAPPRRYSLRRKPARAVLDMQPLLPGFDLA
jgi:phosphoribosyl 1,2-cyclic phosphodiesterase